MIFYTNRFVPKGFAGCARGPIIFIRPEYRHDKGLLSHEKVHRKQWLRTLGLHSLLYLFVPEYRLAAEVEAYKVQMKHNPENARLFARYIATKYRLDITADSAMKLLLE